MAGLDVVTVDAPVVIDGKRLNPAPGKTVGVLDLIIVAEVELDKLVEESGCLYFSSDASIFKGFSTFERAAALKLNL